MKTLMRLRVGILALLVPLASAPAARADEILFRNNVVTCIATTPVVTQMLIERVRFGITTDYAWGQARIRVLFLDRTERVYKVRGYATLLKKQVTTNRVIPTYSYQGVKCSAQHRNLTAVQNCRANETSKKCDVGLRFSGSQHVYGVSLTVEPATSGRRTYER